MKKNKIFILCAFFILYVYASFCLIDREYGRNPLNDQYLYLQEAKTMSKDIWYWGCRQQGPVYSRLLAMAGIDDIRAGRIFNIFLSLVSVAWLYCLTKDLILWIICVFFVLLPKTPHVQVEVVFYVSFFAAIVYLQKVIASEKKIDFFLAGMAVAGVYLIKATGLILAPLFCLFLYRRPKMAMFFFLGFVSISWPYLLQNYMIYGNPVYSPHNGDLIKNFITGKILDNFINACGFFFNPGSIHYFAAKWLVILAAMVVIFPSGERKQWFIVAASALMLGLSLCWVQNLSRFYLSAYLPIAWILKRQSIIPKRLEYGMISLCFFDCLQMISCLGMAGEEAFF